MTLSERSRVPTRHALGGTTPGDPKERPASVGTERGAHRDIKSGLGKSSKRRNPAQAIERHSFAAYDGHDVVFIEQTGNHFVATTTPHRVELRNFRTLKAAFREISEAHGGSHAR